MQADYFRYCAVFVLGGVYADADLRCLRELGGLGGREGVRGVLFGRRWPLPEEAAGLYRWRYPVGPYCALGNGMFAFRDPGDPLLELTIEIATASIERRIADGPAGVWLTAGPGIFTSLYLLRELGSTRAFRDYVLGSVLEPSAELFCSIADRLTGTAAILDDIDIQSRAARHTWVEPLDIPQPPGAHWMTREGTIFRS